MSQLGQIRTQDLMIKLSEEQKPLEQGDFSAFNDGVSLAMLQKTYHR